MCALSLLPLLKNGHWGQEKGGQAWKQRPFRRLWPWTTQEIRVSRNGVMEERVVRGIYSGHKTTELVAGGWSKCKR